LLSLRPFAFHRFQTTTVELKELSHIFLGLGSACAAEPRCGRRGTSNSRSSGNKLEQIESNIFVATSPKSYPVDCFHLKDLHIGC